jgi:hypothetical protein
VRGCEGGLRSRHCSRSGSAWRALLLRSVNRPLIFVSLSQLRGRNRSQDWEEMVCILWVMQDWRFQSFNTGAAIGVIHSSVPIPQKRWHDRKFCDESGRKKPWRRPVVLQIFRI